VIILSAVVLFSVLLFFYFRNKRSGENNYVINSDTAQKIKQEDKNIVAVPPPVTPAVETQPKTNEVNKTPVDEAGKKHSVVPTHNESETRNANKVNHPAALPRVLKNLSEQLLVKFSTNEPCRIIMKDVNTGIERDTDELSPGVTLKMYLKPGKYLITATSLRDASKKRDFPFDIRMDDVNQVVTRVINF
jgi:hypothetical protein